MKISRKSIELFKAIEELVSMNGVKVASIANIAKKLNKKRNAVAKHLFMLKNAKYVESPIWGGYRLTKKAMKAMDDVSNYTCQKHGSYTISASTGGCPRCWFEKHQKGE